MLTALAGRVRFARALQSRPFALLWVGQTISLLGDGAFYTAMAWQVLLLTHSATAMGIVMVAEMVPRLLFLLIGGVTADRLPRRLVLLWSDAGRAIVVLFVAALGWLHLLQLWHFVGLALIYGFVDGFFLPAYQSLPPQLVQAEDLPSANALSGLSWQLSQLLGPAIGAICVALAGPTSAIAFDGLTFVVSALCLLAIRLPIDVKTVAMDRPAGRQGGIRGVIADTRVGISYVTSSTWLWVTILVASVGVMGFTGPTVVALPKLVHDVYGTGVWLLGALGTANALGSITGTFLVGQMRHLRRRGLVAYLAIGLSSIAFIAFGLPLPRTIMPVIACIANALVGFGFGIFQVIWITVMQELVPADKLGRVSSIDFLGSLCLTPISFAIVGPLADHVGPGWVFIAGGILNLALTLMALCVRDIRRLE